MPEKEDIHIGFKGTAKFLGWMLGFIYAIFVLIKNWIPAATITMDMISNLLVGVTTCVLGIPAIFYVGDIIWTLAHKVKERIFS